MSIVEDSLRSNIKAEDVRQWAVLFLEKHQMSTEKLLYEQCFSYNPIYNAQMFIHRFYVLSNVFNKVLTTIINHDTYFVQKKDCTGKLGLSPLQKVTCAFRILAYGVTADYVDESLCIGESTALQCLKHVVEAIDNSFGHICLCQPTDESLKRILRHSQARGFHGMLGSIDCCKWEWKNCPTAFHGQYQGKEGVTVVTREAISDFSLWIWHAFFDFPGSGNDINVVEASPLIAKIANGNYPPPLEYRIAGELRNKPYWLADGI